MKVNVTSVMDFVQWNFVLWRREGDNKTVFERVSHVFHFHKFSLQCATALVSSPSTSNIPVNSSCVTERIRFVYVHYLLLLLLYFAPVVVGIQ